jgi:outer membrane immunogenic protein
MKIMKIQGIALLTGLGIGMGAFALPAAAADYGASPAAYNWTGGYVGAQVGYGWGHTDAGSSSFYNDVDGTSLAGTSPALSFGGGGFIGGGEAGYNWQTNNLVFGVVGDISAAGIRSSYAEDSFSVDSTLNWLSTARVNLGLPVSNMLFYGTAGLAIGGVTSDLHDVYDGGATVLNSSHSGTGVGWAAGGGVAAALGSNWVVKGEYLYVDLGSQHTSYSEPSPGWPLISGSAKTTASLLRVSLDPRF